MRSTSHLANSPTGLRFGVAIISYYNESASDPLLELLLQVVFVVCWATPITRRIAPRSSSGARLRERTRLEFVPLVQNQGRMAEEYSTPTITSP